MADLTIRGGLVVNAEGAELADVRIEGGTIVEVGRHVAGGGPEINAHGLVIMPGLVDVHVHFNEPGRTEWEGGETGSRALAAGGGTTFADMPLNSTPCVLTAHECDRKRAALEAVSIADFGLWGGLVPGHIHDMREMADRGVVGFKAFMCDSGLSEFPRADEDTLAAGMVEARRLALPVAVHAEDDAMIHASSARTSGHGAEAFLASRPLEAELRAIARALELAEETGVALHIVHVSSGQGVALAAAARARGVDVSIETCPHYLTFTDEDLETVGVTGKCAPPFRSAGEQRALWAAVADGRIDLIASDHSPAPPSMKVAGDFVGSWGGVAGVQSTLMVLLTHGAHERHLPLQRVAELTATTPARRFRIPRKGALASGYDADIAIVDFDAAHTLVREDLFQRHALSPYIGRAFRGIVRQTLRRGETIFKDGRMTAMAGGRMVRPDRKG